MIDELEVDALEWSTRRDRLRILGTVTEPAMVRTILGNRSLQKREHGYPCAREARENAARRRRDTRILASVADDYLHVVAFATSGHGSQASPAPSPSASACFPLSIGRIGLKTFGQSSIASAIPSPSASVALAAPV